MWDVAYGILLAGGIVLLAWVGVMVIVLLCAAVLNVVERRMRGDSA